MSAFSVEDWAASRCVLGPVNPRRTTIKRRKSNMLANTKTLVVAAINTDPSISDDMKMLALKVLSGHGKEVYGGSVAPLVVSRSEAATMMGLGPKRIDDFTRGGILKRVYMPGSSRATGILRSSVESAVMSGVR